MSDGPPTRPSPVGRDRCLADPDPDRNPLDQIDTSPYSRRPGYAEMPFADAMQAELLEIELNPDPDTGYRVGDHTGNVRECHRR